MTEYNLQPLPLGTSDFSALRDAGLIYVDKTSLIHEIASKRQKFFISRPRRFGKSLLISTFESLFKYGIRDFKGLAIEKLWQDRGVYRVVRLDFSQVKNFSSEDEFLAMLDRYLIDLMFRENLKSPIPTSTEGLRAFSNWLAVQPKNSVVLLIDEYDAPLTACLNDDDLFEKVRSKLSAFYSAVKSNDMAVRFFFITGITKFNKTSIFSDLNNFSDLTLQPKYGTLLGYTHEEVQKYFSNYLARASDILGIYTSQLMSELKLHYDGFCFDRKVSSHVFVPWSLLKFFDSPEDGFLDYWFESGGRPSALIQYLKSHSLKSPEEYGKEKSIPLATLADSSDLKTLTDVGLLTQAGYLTIKSVKYGDTVYVDYPNSEVRRAMAQLYMEQMLSGRTAGQVGAGPIIRVLSTEGAESIFHILNRLFASIDYQDYPVQNEYSVRAFVQVYLAGSGLNPKVEVHNYLGRSDLEIQAANRHWVLEFKYCRDNDNPDRLLKDALKQIQNRHYGENISDVVLIRVALVFSEKERQFIRWAHV